MEADILDKINLEALIEHYKKELKSYEKINEKIILDYIHSQKNIYKEIIEDLEELLEIYNDKFE